MAFPSTSSSPTSELSQPQQGVLTLIVLLFLLVLPLTSWANEALDHFNQAHTEIEKGHYPKALDSLQLALEVYPRFAEAHHLLGIVYFTGFKQPDKAISALKLAVLHYPNFAQAYLDLGAVLHHQKKMADAEAAYGKALELYPHFLEARLALANLHVQMERPQKAIRAFSAILELQPDNSDALYQLAVWQDRAGKTEEAQKVLDRLLKTDDKHLNGWLLQGEIFEKEKNSQEAIEAYNHAVNLKGDLIQPHEALGFLYQEQGNGAKAAKHLAEVIKLAPKNPEAHHNFGVVLAGLKRLDEAEQAYQTAITLDPNLTDAYYNLGLFYEFHRKNTKKALRQYREYIKRGGTDERITNLLKKIEK